MASLISSDALVMASRSARYPTDVVTYGGDCWGGLLSELVFCQQLRVVLMSSVVSLLAGK
jgi:hypothetical protein